jgi:hypothetical protein
MDQSEALALDGERAMKPPAEALLGDGADLWRPPGRGGGWAAAAALVVLLAAHLIRLRHRRGGGGRIAGAEATVEAPAAASTASASGLATPYSRSLHTLPLRFT